MKGILSRTFSWHTDTILIAEPDQVLRQLECGALSSEYQIVSTCGARKPSELRVDEFREVRAAK